jgi:magnesium transporter
VDLRKTLTVEDAIKRIRRIGEDRETIYTCYVIDDERYLQGVVTVKDLLMAHDSDTIEEIMEPDVIAVTTAEHQETAARQMAKYDLIALPVVDAEGRLVGIVTVDDAVDVIQEEATEDFEKMAAMAPSEKPYLKTGVFALSRNRFAWLLVLMVSATVTGGIIGHFEAAFLAMPLLLTFTPMLTDAGGNAGSQSSTMVIRGMALGEITMKDFFAVVWKEAQVSLLVALPLAAINYGRVLLSYPGQHMVALTVSLALVCTVVLANAVGGMLPMLAKVCKLDPALMAAPLISTIVDACSLILYFVIALALLPI